MSQLFHIPPEGIASGEIANYRLDSTKLLIRAGYIQSIGKGFYGYLPLGMRVVKNIGRLISREYRALGGEEMLLPLVNPAEIWERSGRNVMVSRELTSLEDSKAEPLVLAPMHEEASIRMLSKSISSADQLPRFLYQFQGKFRDEVLDGSGLFKAREFLMNDAYSFHRSFSELNNFLPKIYSVYQRLFLSLGLDVITTEGAANFTGGASSYDFLMPHPLGEDILVSCPNCGYNANQDVAASRPGQENSGRPLPMEQIHHEDCHALPCLRKKRGLPSSRTVDCSMYKMSDGYVLAVKRSDKSVSMDKLSRVVGKPILASVAENELTDLGYPWFEAPKNRRRRGETVGPSAFIGPVNPRKPQLPEGETPPRFIMAVDTAVSEGRNYIVSGGVPGSFYINVNFGRDFDADVVGDFVMAETGSLCYHCGARLEHKRSLKLASVYRIGEYFSRRFDFRLTDDRGRAFYPAMGAYGIGLGRLLASLIEAHRYRSGFVLPMNVAPFKAGLIVVGRGATVQNIGQSLHNDLKELVLFDDRKIPVGQKFRELDKIGIPLRIVISGQTMDDGHATVWHCRLSRPERIPLGNLREKIETLSDLEQQHFTDKRRNGCNGGTNA